MFEALYGKPCRSPIYELQHEDRPSTEPDDILDNNEKILRTAQSRQKSYADQQRRPLEFEEDDCILLRVSLRKVIMRFGIEGKLAPRYIRSYNELVSLLTILLYHQSCHMCMMYSTFRCFASVSLTRMPSCSGMIYQSKKTRLRRRPMSRSSIRR